MMNGLLKLWTSGDGFNIYYSLYFIYGYFLYNEWTHDIIKDTIIITHGLAMFELVKAVFNPRSSNNTRVGIHSFPSGHVFMFSLIYGIILSRLLNDRITLYYYPVYTIFWIVVLGVFQSAVSVYCRYHTLFQSLITVGLSALMCGVYEVKVFDSYFDFERRMWNWGGLNLYGHIGIYVIHLISTYLSSEYAELYYKRVLSKCLFAIYANYVIITINVLTSFKLF
jgi:hypothetical protein